MKNTSGSCFRPARCLEGDGSSQASGRAARWYFPSIQWRVGTRALWQPGCACGTDNHVAGGHAVAGLGCEAPGIGYRQSACPCGPRSGGGYGVRLAEKTRGGRTISHRDLLRAADVGETGGFEGDCDRNIDCPCKCRCGRSLRTFFGHRRHRTKCTGVRVEVSQDARLGLAICRLGPNRRRNHDAAHANQQQLSNSHFCLLGGICKSVVLLGAFHSGKKGSPAGEFFPVFCADSLAQCCLLALRAAPGTSYPLRAVMPVRRTDSEKC
jgi:hypothetical protein